MINFLPRVFCAVGLRGTVVVDYLRPSGFSVPIFVSTSLIMPTKVIYFIRRATLVSVFVVPRAIRARREESQRSNKCVTPSTVQRQSKMKSWKSELL